MKAVVNNMVVGLHKEPDVQSTLEDEVLYGMPVDILSEPHKGWVQIRTHYRYEGLVRADELLTDKKLVSEWEQLPKMVVRNKNFCDVLAEPRVQARHVRCLTRGCAVSPIGKASKGWRQVRLADGQTGYVMDGILAPLYTEPLSSDEKVLRRELTDAALLYHGTHYRWGGKSPMGIDCSGLVSMAYMLCGILIHRDASMAGGFPIHEITLEEAKPGDLLFFPGHVAMLMGGDFYCHSTARAGSDGFTLNSLIPAHPDYRADLAQQITHVGSFFTKG